VKRGKDAEVVVLAPPWVGRGSVGCTTDGSVYVERDVSTEAGTEVTVKTKLEVSVNVEVNVSVRITVETTGIVIIDVSLEVVAPPGPVQTLPIGQQPYSPFEARSQYEVAGQPPSPPGQHV
jgi:hypothetical protein